VEWKQARDIALFVAGLAGVFHETIVATEIRMELLIVFAAMLGLPAFMRIDERKWNENGE
jgi:hypothetical protein